MNALKLTIILSALMIKKNVVDTIHFELFSKQPSDSVLTQYSPNQTQHRLQLSYNCVWRPWQSAASEWNYFFFMEIHCRTVVQDTMSTSHIFRKTGGENTWQDINKDLSIFSDYYHSISQYPKNGRLAWRMQSSWCPVQAGSLQRYQGSGIWAGLACTALHYSPRYSL